ncbi:MAG: bifunctional metallophosphatase/5'-nucleotidase [Eubacterium sp.]|nr:bifunctional metallophosphatase/5'-nucleotidase [Eubacterium sp.]
MMKRVLAAVCAAALVFSNFAVYAAAEDVLLNDGTVGVYIREDDERPQLRTDPPADFKEFEESYEGKTVVLQTNDVHGAIDQYQYLAGVRDLLRERGADVYLVDSGDYMQGDIHVSWDKGASGIAMLQATGYDVVTIGNHEFDYGYPRFDEEIEALQSRGVRAICNDIMKEDPDGNPGEPLFDGTYMIENGDLKIGLFGIDTPQTKTSSSPSNTKGLVFLDNETAPKVFDQAADDIKSLRKDGADVVLALAHLGVDAAAKPYRSYDFWDALSSDPELSAGADSPSSDAELSAGADAVSSASVNAVETVDLILDGHSHTVMTQGPEGQPIMQTGTKLVNIGVVVIDEKTEKIDDWFLYKITEDTPSNSDVKAAADEINEKVDELYSKIVCASEVELNGFKDKASAEAAGKDFPSGNRDGETNFGDFTADSLKALATRSIQSDEQYDVDEDHIVGLINGGAIRAGVQKGDVSQKNILSAFPFGNSIGGVYVTGSQLLEALEASTSTTPEAIGGFPQVSGIDYTINIAEPYHSNPEPYPGTTIYGPSEIRRVKINKINGKPFDPDDTYLVMTISFLIDGGDTYYVFGQSEKSFDTGILDVEVLTDFVKTDLGGKIGTEYAEPAGRIQIVEKSEKKANPIKIKTRTKKISVKTLKKKAVKVKPIKVTKAKGKVTYKKGKVKYKKAGAKKYKKAGKSIKARFTVNKKTGAIRVKKGTAKGTYKIKVTVTASGNETYKTKKKTVTATVRVR